MDMVSTHREMVSTVEPFVILNPSAGGGRGKKLWPKIAQRLEKELGPFQCRASRGPGDARRIAAEAASQGCHLLIACGGDGTIHEVVNGLHDAGIHDTSKSSKKTKLGIISIGTGGDFIKTLKIPPDPLRQIEIIKKGKIGFIDLGQVEYTNDQGDQDRRVFINITDAGLGAEVVRQVCHSRTLFGRKLAYLTAVLTSYISWKGKKIDITTEPKVPFLWPQKPLAVVVANGRYFGGGMPIAPDADPTDGLFDLVVIGDLSPLKIPLAVPFLYAKKIDRLNGVATACVRQVTLRSQEKVGLDIDGEPIGFLPAKFSILPKALEVFVP